jgi:hypothetical protein
MNDSFNNVFGDGFDTHSVEPQSDFALLPPGKYTVVVEKAEVKQTKKGDGHYVALVLSVLDGQYKNRKVFDRINIDNPNQQCVEIGFRCLAALGQALGLTKITDSNQLVNGVCVAHVKVKDEQNEVRTYSATNTGQTTDAAVDTANRTQAIKDEKQTAPAGTSGGSKPPWAR